MEDFVQLYKGNLEITVNQNELLTFKYLRIRKYIVSSFSIDKTQERVGHKIVRAPNLGESRF